MGGTPPVVQAAKSGNTLTANPRNISMVVIHFKGLGNSFNGIETPSFSHYLLWSILSSNEECKSFDYFILDKTVGWRNIIFKTISVGASTCFLPFD